MPAKQPTPESNAASIDRLIRLAKWTVGIMLIMAGLWATFMYRTVDQISSTAKEAKDSVIAMQKTIGDMAISVEVINTKLDYQAKFEGKLESIEQRLRDVEAGGPKR